MAVSTNLNKHIYVGNGTNKTWSVGFRLLQATDLKLYLTNITTSAVSQITTNYNITPTGGSFPADTCSVTYPVSGSAITSDYKLTLVRQVDITQETVYPTNTALKPKVVEKDLDKSVMIDQQLAEALARCIKTPISDEGTLDTDEYLSQVLAAASGATTSATNAATSATNAANSATSAATSAATIGGFLDYTVTAKTADIITKGPRVDVRAFGAKGDGITDDTTSILAAFAVGKPVYFPAGTYIVSSEIPYSCSFFGDGQTYTIIKASSTFSGSMMVDFNQSPHEMPYIIGICFDANNKPIRHFGSTSSGSAGGGSQSYFERLLFINTPNGVYSVGGDSSVAEAGMLTGAVFNRCTWNGCSQALNVGNNQDDALFIGCRIHMDGAATTNYFIRVVGSNIKFINTYAYLASSNNATFKAPIYIGSNPIKIDGLFIESNTCNLQGIFFANDPSTHLSIENVIYRVISSSDVAFVRTINKDSAYYCLKNIKIHSDITTTVHALQFYCDGSEITSTFEFSGIDGFTNLVNILSSSSLTKKMLILNGTYKNILYGNILTFAPPNTYIYNDNITIDSKSKLVQNYSSGTNSASSTPQTYAYQLPSDGLWLVTCRAMLDGSKDHMSMGVFAVTWFNSTYNVKSVTSLSANATNSPYTIGTMTATMTTAGVITFSLPWTAGGTHVCVFEVNAIKQL